MPIFEFQCEECGEVFEELVFSEKEEVVCRKCQSPKVKKLISRVAFKCGAKFTGTSSGGSCQGCKGGNCQSCR